MTCNPLRSAVKPVTALFLVAALASCSDFDLDMRQNFSGGFDTSNAARLESQPRPRADDRGIISYPNYQIAVARGGDTVESVAARIGMDAAVLARFNGVPQNTRLRENEILALPERVQEPSAATGAIATGPIRPAGEIDIQTLAGAAIDRADPNVTGSIAPGSITTAQGIQTGKEPVRHKVIAGETAYSISRLYGVSVQSLQDWNGLGLDLGVRSGQYLLIPVAAQTATTPAASTKPGVGTLTPTPPSAMKPLPKPAPRTAANTKPASPNLSDLKTSASTSRMDMPVSGSVIRDFSKGRNEGIDIAAKAGTPVRAAAKGTVAAITRDTEQVPIIVLRHDGGLLTVYAQVESVKVAKGDAVARGQTIAQVRAGTQSFVHFEVRKGLEAVDPTPYLNE
ncbi:MAG: LysM repeat protein [Paracoccaceae bacterium]|jgi:LysM repeat protein